MRRSYWISAVVVGLAVGALMIFRTMNHPAPVRYRTATVERGRIESRVSATGTVRPVIQVEVGSQVSGTVQKLFADYNSRVHRGDLLLQIEPSTFHARMAQAEAATSRAEAGYRDAQRQLARARELLPQKYIAQADVDAAQALVDQREADRQQAHAQLEAARLDLDHTTIRAPIEGVVISRSIDVGQTVAASLQAPKLFVLANDLARMQVETRIDEADIGQVRVGLPVTFTVDAFPEATFEGTVSQVRLEPITEQGVVTYTTVIGARNPELRLRPGMTANVSVLIESRDDVLKVPAAALRFRPADETRAGNGAMRGPAAARPAAAAEHGGAGAGRPGVAESPGRPSLRQGAVYVQRGGRPARIRVLTGLSDGTWIEVRSDSLAEGDAVITGIEMPVAGSSNLQPPPGMGGPQFRGPGGRGGGGRR